MVYEKLVSIPKWRKKCLSPAKQKIKHDKVYGFDIETHGNKNEFLCASIYGDDYDETFFTKQDTINAFKNSIFRGAIIAATNLSFDFYGLFLGTEEEKCFLPLFNGGRMLSAKTWLDDKSDFFLKTHKDEKSQGIITFIDTMNYAPFGVQKLGEILGIPKLDAKEIIGRKNLSDEEWKTLIKYNKRDAEISKKFIEFLYIGFEKAGATPKLTIASTAMSVFKNKYLDQMFWVQPLQELLDIMKSYYGGRTECFVRGEVFGANYYDINSMYPACMLEALPDPNSCHTCHHNNTDKIINFEGVSEVELIAPEQIIPLLPVRHDTKLLFPYGELPIGWYTHIELREALRLGYKIENVLTTHYYTKTGYYLKEYAEDMYKIRSKMKSDGDPLEIVYKLLLNSLYGKFGQKFNDKETYKREEQLTIKDTENAKLIEHCNGYVRIISDGEPAAFCIPIWASYITARARIMLHRLLFDCKPIYCDTDSIVTKSVISTSSELGKLKLEANIKHGVFVRPKMYAFEGVDEKSKKISVVKVKGLKKKILLGDKEVSVDLNTFSMIMHGDKIFYKKFMKLKESIKRGFVVNEIITQFKEFDLEDTKRDWPKLFDPKESQRSTPIYFKQGIPVNEFNKKYKKVLEEDYDVCTK